MVIPAYEEAARLPGALREIQDYLARKVRSYEIIVVDDGSKDRTVELARQSLNGIPHLILSNGTNYGKGFCVRKGMLAAKGRLVFFTDADLSTPIQELDRVFPYLEQDYDIVIGSRAVEDPIVKVHRKMLWYREIMGRTFNFIAQLILGYGIVDSQCGFKCFKQEAARDLFLRQKLNGFSFDAEILYLARKRGYRVKEMAVAWIVDPKSKVRIIQDSIRMFFELIRIRWIHRKDSR